MNKKVLGTVLGSCLFLCGDYGCAAPRDVVIGKTTESAGKTLVGLLKDPDVKNITFNGVTKSCSEWEELLKGYKGSGVGVSVYLVTALSRGVSKMGDDDISAAKDFGEKCRAKRVKRVCEFNDKLGGNSTIKSSSHAPGVTSPSGGKKDVELESLRSELSGECLTYFSGDVDKNDVSVEVVKALLEKCSDKEKLKSVVENLKRKYYDEGLGGKLFVFVVGNDLGMGEVLALEKMLDRSGDKAKLKTGFNKGSTLVALDAFGKDGSKTCKDCGFAEFVELVKDEKIDVSGAVTKADIEDVLVEYREDLSKKEKEKQLKELREKTEGVLGEEKFKKICVDGEGKTDSGKCEIVCKLFTRESFETLSSGLDSESVVKITEYLVGMESKTDRKEVREQIWKDGSYQNSLTGGQVVWGANLSDEGKARLNKDNVVFVLKRPYDECLDERLAAYDASKAKEYKMKTLRAAYLETNGAFVRFRISEDYLKIHEETLSLTLNGDFQTYCTENIIDWLAAGGLQTIEGLDAIVSNEEKSAQFVVLLSRTWRAVVSVKSQMVKRCLENIVKLVNGEEVKGIKLDMNVDYVQQTIQTCKALAMCTSKKETEKAIKCFNDKGVGYGSEVIKIDLEGVCEVKDNGNVKIGDREYNGCSFITILTYPYTNGKWFDITEFNEKDTVEGKQAYLNSVAQGLGVKPVEPEAE